MLYIKKGFFPFVEISICGPPSYSFQFSQELSFLFIVLDFKVQTLRALNGVEKAREIWKMCSDANAMKTHKSHVCAVETNFQLLFDIAERQLPYGKLILDRSCCRTSKFYKTVVTNRKL